MVRTRLGDNELASSKRKSKSPKGYSYEQDHHSGVFDHQMELDDPPLATNGSSRSVTDEDLLVYGSELRNEFKATTQSWVRGELDNILGLMAYENPKTSTLGHLLEEEGRVGIADELNKAILGKLSL
jgi:Ran-binding protein 9/10